MKKEKKTEDMFEDVQDQECVQEDNNNSENQTGQSEADADGEEQLKALKAQLEDKSRKCEEYLSMAQRITAEFENYKKRTAREKEALYAETAGDVVLAFLPVVDNMERALQAASKDGDSQSLREGIDLVFRQLKNVMSNLGVEEIKSVGEKFNPQLHNAVMHVTDELQDESVILEEFQKGYTLKDKVIRHSMVKVAN